MASIKRTKDMLHNQLGGEWHIHETKGRIPYTRDDFHMPVDMLEHMDYFWARLDTEYALLLSAKLAEIGVNVEGISGEANHVPNGKTDIRIKREGIDTLAQNAIHDNGKRHPIRWHIETELGLPHSDRGVV